MPSVGMTRLQLARPGLDVAKDQLPSPWSLGAPAGKDICQRESWQPYFLFHLGLSLIHPSCSFPLSSPSLPFLPFSSHSTLLLLFFFLCLSLSHSPLSLSSILSLDGFLLSSSSLSVSPVSYKAPQPPPPASAFPLVSSLHVGVDDILALHMTVPANWAKAWRRAGGQEYSLPVHDEDTCHVSMVSLSSCIIFPSSFILFLH